MKRTSKILAVALCALDGQLFAPAASAQVTTRPPQPAAAAAQPGPSLRTRIRTQLDQVLPRWDAGLLDVPEEAPWSDRLTLARVLGALQDPATVPRELPATAERVQLGATTVVARANLGTVRYTNGDRSWTLDRDRSTVPVDTARAHRVVQEALLAIGLPVREFGPVRIESQIAVSAPITSKVPTDSFLQYRVVSVARRINSIPVHESRTFASVNHQGAIQRLRVSWPAFRLTPGLTVRTRAEVVNQVLEEIMSQSPNARISIQARIAYAPHDTDDPDVWYVPAVIVAVEVGETPYVLVVPVARVAR